MQWPLDFLAWDILGLALWDVAREPLGLLEALWASFAGVANDRVLVARPLASPIFSAALGGFFRRPFFAGLSLLRLVA